MSLRANGPLSDISKYGGYNGAKIAYFVLLKTVDKKGKEGFRLDAVPLHLSARLETSEAKLDYFKNKLSQRKVPLKVSALVLPVIPKQSLLSIDGFPAYLAKKESKENVGIRHAIQLCLSDMDARILKKILEYNDRQRKAKILSKPESDGITTEMALQLYDAFIAKLAETIYSKRFLPIADILQEGKALFSEMSLDEKCRMIEEILHLFQCNATTANLEIFNGPKEAGKFSISYQIKKDSNISLITQSVTGFFEKKIPLWKGDE